MTASRAEAAASGRRTCLVPLRLSLGAVALLLALAGSAVAQTTGDPVQLQAPEPTATGTLPEQPAAQPMAPAPGVTTPIRLAPLNQPQPATPEAREETQPATTSVAPSAVASPQPARGIEVDTLADIELDSLGVLDPGAGGLGLDIWSGSDRTVIERLLLRLPGRISSPALRDLAVRLLLSSATAPVRQTLALQPGESRAAQDHRAGRNSLLRHRLDRLAALGETDGLNDLLRAIPLRFDDETVARLRVNGLLLEGDLDNACKLVQNGIARYHREVFWPKALVFCQLVDGRIDQAMLGLDLLRETEPADDAAMAVLIAHVAGTLPSELSGAAITPLSFAIMRQFQQPLPADLAEVADLGMAVALARSESAPLEQRVIAAERAAATGAGDAELLAQVYGSFEFTPEQLNSAISAAATMQGPAGRALLYQAAQQQPIAVARAEILRVMLEAALADGSYATLLPLLLPILAEVPAMPELDWFAEPAARALYVGGRFERAAAWAQIARQAEITADAPGSMTSGIWPFERLAGVSGQRQKFTLADWRRLREEAGRGDAAAQQALLLLAFRALGEADPLSWAQVTAGGALPRAASDTAAVDAGALYALIDAGASGRLGETVLLSLILMGETRPSNGNPVALGAVMTMLAQVGLGQEARALAMEAAVGERI